MSIEDKIRTTTITEEDIKKVVAECEGKSEEELMDMLVEKVFNVRLENARKTNPNITREEFAKIMVAEAANR